MGRVKRVPPTIRISAKGWWDSLHSAHPTSLSHPTASRRHDTHESHPRKYKYAPRIAASTKAEAATSPVPTRPRLPLVVRGCRAEGQAPDLRRRRRGSRRVGRVKRVPPTIRISAKGWWDSLHSAHPTSCPIRRPHVGMTRMNLTRGNTSTRPESPPARRPRRPLRASPNSPASSACRPQLPCRRSSS